jgi:cell division septum initiation protein DivIVA
MSLSQSFFPSETDEILNPQFNKALKGFNVEEVEDYVEQAKRRIEVLESHLDKALDERDRLRHQLASVKPDAYRVAGERLAGILRSIDEHVDGIRRQAEEDAARQIAEAKEQAETLKHQAEGDGVRVRAEAGGILQRAQEEAAKVLGSLTDRRDALEHEIESLRGVLISLLERLTVPSATEEPAEASTQGDEPTDAIVEAQDIPEDADWDVDIDIAPTVVDLRDISIDEGS